MSWQCRQETKKAFKQKAEEFKGKYGIPPTIRDLCFEQGVHPERETGRVAVEGPFPLHKWYATVELDDKGNILKIT